MHSKCIIIGILLYYKAESKIHFDIKHSAHMRINNEWENGSLLILESVKQSVFLSTLLLILRLWVECCEWTIFPNFGRYWTALVNGHTLLVVSTCWLMCIPLSAYLSNCILAWSEHVSSVCFFSSLVQSFITYAHIHRHLYLRRRFYCRLGCSKKWSRIFRSFYLLSMVFVRLMANCFGLCTHTHTPSYCVNWLYKSFNFSVCCFENLYHDHPIARIIKEEKIGEQQKLNLI